MKIIDADKFLVYLIFSKHIDELSCGEVKEAIEMCKIFPEDTTNGEIIQTLFPNIDMAFSNVIDLNLWWNAKYKAKSEVENK